MSQKLPLIYDFIDVKVYLRAYRTARKLFDEGFTNLYICYKLGQKNSKGYFNNVINGRVRIGATLAERFIKLLELDENETLYFRALITYSQTADRAEQELAFREMALLSPANTEELTENSISYYLHWRYAVVRALLDVYDFDGSDYKELMGKLIEPISLTSLKEAINLLTELNLVEYNDDGLLKPTATTISHGESIHRELLLRYQSKNFDHSAEVIVNHDVRPQKVTSLTLSMSEDTYNTVKERVTSLKNEIKSLVANESKNSERLYQLNVHLFPLSK